MKAMNCLLLTVIAAGVLSAGAVSAADVKIATVNMTRVMKAHPETKANMTVLEKQKTEFENELKALKEQREKMEKEFKVVKESAENRALSEDVRREKVKEAEEKFQALMKFNDEMRETAIKRQKQFSDQGQRMAERVQEKIAEAVREYAKKKGYTLVLDSAVQGMSGLDGVVYAEEKMDDTAEILKITGGSEPGK